MDSGLTIRPTGAVPQTTLSRSEPVPVRQAVATQLAPSQSVTASTDVAATRNDAPSAAPTEPSVSHDVAIDPQTHELIYRVVEQRTGRVIRQSPDKLMLSIAAYNRAIAKGEGVVEAEVKADLEI
jgi:hypothetical protein